MMTTMAISPAARPRHLPYQEAIRRAEALFRHHGRGAEHHHQADEDQQQGDGEHPFVDADSLGHLFTASRNAASYLIAFLLPRRQLPDQLFEDLSALLVTVELIEAGTSRSQEHDVARTCGFAGALDCAFQRSDADDSVPFACDSIFAAAAPMVYTRLTRSFSKSFSTH